jgi:protein gp37
MAQNTKIEWSEFSWNPVTGCSKISPGCKNCYAKRMSGRLQAMGQKNYRNGFEVTTHEHMLVRPFEWRKPRMIFVNSMSDLFHSAVPEKFIRAVFNVMQNNRRHNFQVLTKRAKRMERLSSHLPWSENVWMGVSVETEDYLFRIDHLRETPAHIKFISLEPLLGPLPGLDLTDIDWVIVGGESGPGARPIKKEWVINIRNKCLEAGVSLFFKQWGGVNKKKAGRELDGRTWDQFPEA